MSRSSFTKHGVLGGAFQACRALQFACLITAIGLSAHLTSQLLPSRPPTPLIGALTTACFAALYTLISYLLYFDAQLPAHLGAAADTLCLIALSTTAGVLGAPISCNIGPAPAPAAFDPTKAFTEATTPPAAAAADTVPYLTPESGTVYHLRARFVVAEVGYSAWVGSAEETCVMVQCVWGLAVVAAVLFAVSALCLGGLWWRERMARRGERMEEGEEKREYKI